MHVPRSSRAIVAIATCIASLLYLLPTFAPAPAAAATTKTAAASSAPPSYGGAPATLLTVAKFSGVKITRGITTYTIYVSRVGRRYLYDHIKNVDRGSTGALIAAASTSCLKIGSPILAAVCGVAAAFFGGYIVDKIVQSTRQAACLKIKGYNPAFPVGGPMRVFEFSVLPKSNKNCKTRY